MKRLLALFSLTIAITASMVFSGGVHAYAPLEQACQGNETVAACEQAKSTADPITGSDGILIKAINLIAIFGGIVAVIVIMIAGIRFVTSAGDPSKVASARNTILFTVVGIIVMIVGRSIIMFVINRVG